MGPWRQEPCVHRGHAEGRGGTAAMMRAEPARNRAMSGVGGAGGKRGGGGTDWGPLKSADRV